jgi:hypothetical protein
MRDAAEPKGDGSIARRLYRVDHQGPRPGLTIVERAEPVGWH